MVFHMKTTLIIDDSIMQRLRQEATKRKTTISELVEASLRLYLENEKLKKGKSIPPLPVFSLGGASVDIADREALYQAMEGR
jgi:hypothetical protein